MTSITWSNDVDPDKNDGFRVSKINGDYCRCVTNLDISVLKTHRAVFGDSEFVHGVEKSRARAREARKVHFCTPRRIFAHAHYKLEFDDAER